MKSTETWGWLAAAVLAAGLNAAYHDGGLEWAHRIADRAQHVSGAVAALASGHADRFLAEARMLTVRDDDQVTAFSDSLAAKTDQEVARAEAAYARAEAYSAREQAQCARMQAERARIETRIAAHRAVVRIPQVHIDTAAFRSFATPVVNVPEIRIPEIVIPRVEIPRMKACPGAHFRVPALPNISLPTMPAINVGLSDGPV